MRLVKVPGLAISPSSARYFRGIDSDEVLRFNPDHVLYVFWDKGKQVIIFINDNQLRLNQGWVWGHQDNEIWFDE